MLSLPCEDWHLAIQFVDIHHLENLLILNRSLHSKETFQSQDSHNNFNSSFFTEIQQSLASVGASSSKVPESWAHNLLRGNANAQCTLHRASRTTAVSLRYTITTKQRKESTHQSWNEYTSFQRWVSYVWEMIHACQSWLSISIQYMCTNFLSSFATISYHLHVCSHLHQSDNLQSQWLPFHVFHTTLRSMSEHKLSTTFLISMVIVISFIESENVTSTYYLCFFLTYHFHPESWKCMMIISKITKHYYCCWSFILYSKHIK